MKNMFKNILAPMEKRRSGLLVAGLAAGNVRLKDEESE